MVRGGTAQSAALGCPDLRTGRMTIDGSTASAPSSRAPIARSDLPSARISAKRPMADIAVWTTIAVACALAAAWMAFAGLALDAASAIPLVAAVVVCEGLATAYRRWRPDPRLSASLTAIAQMIVVSGAAGCLSYAVAATGGAPWDGTLAGWDTALGLDWRGYLAVVDGRSWLAEALGLAYASFQLQILLVLLALGFSGRTTALRCFVLAFTLAALATVLVSALTPAVEMWMHLGLDPAAFPNIPPTGSAGRALVLDALRDGTLKTVAFDRIEGIITFPSFHSAVAVLVAASLWPVRALRWPILALDALMLAATPIFGGHYFVDVLSGAAVAGLALAAASAACRALDSGAGRVRA